MNISFWGSMLLMLLVAIALLIFPLLKTRQSKSLAYKTSNVQLHEEKLAELNLDLQEGRIEQDDYKIAKQELDRELLQDIPQERQETAAEHYSREAKKHPALALMIAVFIPALSFLVYMQLGMHAETEQAVAAEPANQQMDIAKMVVKLEQYLAENKGELKDWVMLARTYKHLKRFGEAANAYATANAMEDNPQVLLEHAEVLAVMNGQVFTEEARELVLKALSLAPDNVNTLWFAGVAEFQAGNHRQAITHLSRLSAEAAQDPEIDSSIRFYITQAREQLIAAGEEVASMDELLPKPVVAAGVEISVEVNISDELRNKFAADTAVFVYAKAAQGPKMPLAAQKISLADLPATIILNDSMAMVDGLNLSAFKQVVISARVAKSGSAIAQSGDYIGEINVDDVSSTQSVRVSIDKMVP